MHCNLFFFAEVATKNESSLEDVEFQLLKAPLHIVCNNGVEPHLLSGLETRNSSQGNFLLVLLRSLH